MDQELLPKFANEAEEAQWWYDRHDELTEKAEAAYARGELKLRKLTPSAENSDAPATDITVRLCEQDLERARNFAAKRGVRYQTYLKMLLHEALDAEAKRLAG